jgi:tRNA uridine 5-carbamoylmethylation protein Kti12
MIKLIDILNEGVYDPGIFKAVFTAGGPGSGKSYTASNLFGMPEKMPFVSAKGLKGVNSDSAFETYLDKANLSHDVKSLNPDEYEKAMDLRNQAKRVTAKRMHSYINSKLGMLIDGTGKNYEKISNMKRQLQKQGYDCYMVFVNTSLEVALERNNNRARKLPKDLVVKSHAAVTNNLGKFQGLFGASNMLVVDNSEYKDFERHVVKAANRFVNKPVKNTIAKKWIAKELELKKS